MGQEIMKILGMLENGIISTEEAEKLIEAINNTKSAPKSPSFPGTMMMSKNLMKKIEKIPDIINAKMAEAKIEEKLKRVSNMGLDKKGVFKGVRKVAINMLNGDLRIGASSDKTTFVKGESDINVVNTNGSLAISVNEDDLKVMTPSDVPVAVNNMNGDVEVFGLKRHINLQLYNGDLNATLQGGTIVSQVYNGDVSLKTTASLNGKVNLYDGDLDLEIPEDANMTLKIRLEDGEVDNETEETAQEVKNGRATYVFGSGDKTLKIVSLSGDIRLSTFIHDELDDEFIDEDFEDELIHVEEIEITDDIEEVDDVEDVQSYDIDIQLDKAKAKEEEIKVKMKILREKEKAIQKEVEDAIKAEREVMTKVKVIHKSDDE